MFKLWHAIENSYATTSQSWVLHYQKLLQNIKKWSLSIDAYVYKMKDLIYSLAATRNDTTKIDLINILVSAGYYAIETYLIV